MHIAYLNINAESKRLDEGKLFLKLKGFFVASDHSVIKVIFLNWDLLHARLHSHYKTWSYKKKKQKKIKTNMKCLERTCRYKVSVNSRLKAIRS